MTEDKPVNSTEEKPIISTEETPKPVKKVILHTKSETDKTEDPWKLELFESTNDNLKEQQVEEFKPEKITATPIPKLKKLQRSLSQPAPFSQLSKLNKSCLSSLKPQITSCYNDEENSSFASEIYLYTLLWACVAMLFWKNITLLPLLPLPIIIYVLKHLGLYLGIWQWLGGYFDKLMELIKNWCNERYHAFVPIPARGLYRTIIRVNIAIKDNVKDSIDTVSSIVVILGLIVFVTCASIFFAIQVRLLFIYI